MLRGNLHYNNCLLILHRDRHVLRGKARRIIQAKPEPARAAQPRAHLVAHREEGDTPSCCP